jgi:hypothetical protein
MTSNKPPVQAANTTHMSPCATRPTSNTVALSQSDTVSAQSQSLFLHNQDQPAPMHQPTPTSGGRYVVQLFWDAPTSSFLFKQCRTGIAQCDPQCEFEIRTVNHTVKGSTEEVQPGYWRHSAKTLRGAEVMVMMATIKTGSASQLRTRTTWDMHASHDMHASQDTYNLGHACKPRHACNSGHAYKAGHASHDMHAAAPNTRQRSTTNYDAHLTCCFQQTARG